MPGNAHQPQVRGNQIHLSLPDAAPPSPPRRSSALRPLAAAAALALAAPAAWSQGFGNFQGGRFGAQAAPGPVAPPQFAQICALCHGADALGTDRAPSLVKTDNVRNLTENDIADILRKGKGKMPALPLPPDVVLALAHYVRQLNTTGSLTPVPGDPQAGERYFFGEGRCATCHLARGRGTSNGPDLSSISRVLTFAELKRALVDPDARIADGFGTVTVTLNDGSTLRGFARAQGSHDLVLQTGDGQLHLLLDTEYQTVTPENHSVMPAFQGTADQQRDLLAFLSRLSGAGVGPLADTQQPAATQAQIDQVERPKGGDWPTYNGTLDGNRHSALDQINQQNVARLQLQWTYTIPFSGLETTPLVVDGVLFATGNNQVYALSSRTGREIWQYQRRKSAAGTVSSDAAIGVNRGVAVLGDRVFYLTDDAHLLALDRLTGALLWDVSTPEPGSQGFYGGTSAPLVVGDLVITGVSGGDNGIRGFVAAFKPTTGELVWRLWTIPQYGEPGPGSETWQGDALKEGGGATWLTGSADPGAGIVYWTAGNPHPDTDGDNRLGANLYTDSDLAIDLKTGRMLWYYQFTPHDLHDWDANEPLVLVDGPWRGQDRKLLLHANRNGFLYVLDRTTGKPLLATKMVDKLNWASGISETDWTPQLLPANDTDEKGVKTAPAVRGATNWYSTAYNPSTRLYYVMTVEDYTIYRKADDGGYGRYNNPDDPPQKILRAFDIDTGKVAWKIVLPGPVQTNYSGVLSTAGGLLFFGESTGGFAAVDARTGKYLWHFETNHPMKGSPMTYTANGRQYVAIAAGSNLLSFALPEAVP
jgi:PQQ-dependent dehydrogenase (methanol/ethanol family)